MNDLVKDELFAEINHRIAAGDDTPVGRSPAAGRTVLAAAAAVAVVGGAVGLARIGEDGPRRVTVTPAGETSTTTAVDATFEGAWTLGAFEGRVYNADSEVTVWPDSAESLRGVTFFRLAGTDPRLTPMSVTEWSGGNFGTEVVEVIGDRSIRTPENLSVPSGVTDATRTGPWFFTGPAGVEWMASGLLSDLRLALPSVQIVDGQVRLGPGLEAAPAPVTTSREVHVVKSSRFRIAVSEDSTTDTSFVDPRRGALEAVDVGGRPGVRYAGGSISWRVDDHTVLSVQASPNFGAEQPSDAEVLAAARSARPMSADEFRALPRWRGSFVERVIIRVPAGTPATMDVPASADGSGTAQSSAGIQVEDLTDGGSSIGSFSPGIAWGEDGFAIPLGADRVGHQMRFTLRLPDGTAGCSAEVTVPAEGALPVEVTLDATC